MISTEFLKSYGSYFLLLMQDWPKDTSILYNWQFIVICFTQAQGSL